MTQHNTYTGGQSYRCPGSGMALPPEAVSAWLASYEGASIDAERIARDALTQAEAVLAAAQQERVERSAWCAMQRAEVTP